MINYISHRLASNNELIEIESKLGDKYTNLKDAIFLYLSNLPCDVWIDYTLKTTEKNLPVFIKIICHYIDTHRSLEDYIEFNSTFTRIRRKVCKIKKEIENETQS